MRSQSAPPRSSHSARRARRAAIWSVRGGGASTSPPLRSIIRVAGRSRSQSAKYWRISTNSAPGPTRSQLPGRSSAAITISTAPSAATASSPPWRDESVDQEPTSPLAKCPAFTCTSKWLALPRSPWMR